MGTWTPSNTWFLRSTRVLNPNVISVGSAVFAELTTVTDRQTERPTDQDDRWRRGVAVTSSGVLTRLLYVDLG